MGKGLLIGLFVFFAGCAAAQQNASAMVSFSGAGSVATAGSGFTFMVSGTASIVVAGASPYAGAFSAAGTIGGGNNGNMAGPVSGGFTIITSSGDILEGQLTIPAGLLIPALAGQTAGATGSLTVTGGTGSFAGASGSFPSVSGVGSATGPLSSNLHASGSGTLKLPSLRTAGVPLHAGCFAHLASGGGWKTTITLVSNGATGAGSIEFL